MFNNDYTRTIENNMDHTTANKATELNELNELNEPTEPTEKNEPCLAASMQFALPAYLEATAWAAKAADPVCLLCPELVRAPISDPNRELTCEELEKLKALLATLLKQPEVVRRFDPAVDIWSLGCLLSEKLANANVDADSIRTLLGFLRDLLAKKACGIDAVEAVQFPGSEVDFRRLCQLQRQLLQKQDEAIKKKDAEIAKLQEKSKSTVLNLDEQNQNVSKEPTTADLVIKTLPGQTLIIRGQIIQTLTLRELCGKISDWVGAEWVGDKFDNLRIIFCGKQFDLHDEAKMTTQLVNLGFVFSNEDEKEAEANTAANVKNTVHIVFRRSVVKKVEWTE